MTAPTPPEDHGRDAPPAVVAVSRTGLALFFVYVVLYGGFMGLVLFRPDLLALRPFAGVNLAILAGLGLIVAAFILAIVSMLERPTR
jgi:uncharacterized membrane protein (DUF485 family)